MVGIDLQITGRALEHLRARKRVRQTHGGTIDIGSTIPFGRTFGGHGERAWDHGVVRHLVVHAKSTLRRGHHFLFLVCLFYLHISSGRTSLRCVW